MQVLECYYHLRYNDHGVYYIIKNYHLRYNVDDCRTYQLTVPREWGRRKKGSRLSLRWCQIVRLLDCHIVRLSDCPSASISYHILILFLQNAPLASFDQDVTWHKKSLSVMAYQVASDQNTKHAKKKVLFWLLIDNHQQDVEYGERWVKKVMGGDHKLHPPHLQVPPKWYLFAMSSEKMTFVGSGEKGHDPPTSNDCSQNILFLSMKI